MIMNPLRAFLSRLRAVFTKPALDADFSEELAQHLEAAAADNIRAGMTPEEARRQARIALGGVDQTRELHRDARGLPWLEDLVRDVRFALRGLMKAPGFTFVAILTLALGIGSCAAIFSVINRVLFHPLDVPGDERIVVVRESRAPDLPEFPTSAPNFSDWQNEAKSFETMAAYTFATPSLTGDGEPQQLSARKVTEHYFDVFGTKPMLGRSIVHEDCTPGNDRVVVVSDGF